MSGTTRFLPPLPLRTTTWSDITSPTRRLANSARRRPVLAPKLKNQLIPVYFGLVGAFSPYRGEDTLQMLLRRVGWEGLRNLD
jgi:hypothetical protein